MLFRSGSQLGPESEKGVKSEIPILTQDMLNETCNICRPCHNAVHRIYDNDTLAESFHTIELLLTSEEICKYVKFSSKQKVAQHFSGLKYR